jgi:hypothetical protein
MFFGYIVDVDRLAVENGSAVHHTGDQWSGPSDRDHRGNNPIARHFPHGVAFDAIDLSILGVTQSRGTFCNYIKHGLDIGW